MDQLFDVPDDRRNIFLYLPAVSPKDYRLPDLMRVSKDDLYALISPLRELLRKCNLTFSKASDEGIVKLMRNFIENGKLLKENIAYIYLSFTSFIANVYFVAQASDTLLQCWKKIITSPDVYSKELGKILGRRIAVGRPNTWGSSVFIECIFYPLKIKEITYESGYSSWERTAFYNFSLPAESRQQLAEMFLDKSEVEPQLAESLPENDNFTVGFEPRLFSDLAYLSAMGKTGSPLSSARGTVSGSRLKSIKKDLDSAEIPSCCEKYPIDRVEMLTYAFFTLGENEKDLTTLADPGYFAKMVLKSVANRITGPQFELFLPAFKGFAKTWAESSNARFLTEIAEELIAPGADAWMSLSNLKMRYLCSTVLRMKVYSYTYMTLFDAGSKNNSTLKRRDDTLSVYERRSQNIRWFDEVDFPFLLHWIKFLCAVGIVEIAFSSKCEKNDLLEGMRYVRLTPLGRYAFGIDSEYEKSEADDVCSFEFDDANCIVTLLSDSCPYSFFLRQISLPIGTRRFKITPGSLLKGCDGKGAFAERKANLQKILDIDKTSALKSVVEEADRRTKCVEKVSGGYKIFKVDGSLPGFTEMLLADKEIRKNSILGEKSTIFIKTTFLPRFKEICAKRGYLADV